MPMLKRATALTRSHVLFVSSSWRVRSEDPRMLASSGESCPALAACNDFVAHTPARRMFSDEGRINSELARFVINWIGDKHRQVND